MGKSKYLPFNQVAIFTDKWNHSKTWCIKRSPCGHYYLWQMITNCKRTNWSRVTGKHALNVWENRL